MMLTIELHQPQLRNCEDSKEDACGSNGDVGDADPAAPLAPVSIEGKSAWADIGIHDP
jgi:hypothetical protein